LFLQPVSFISRLDTKGLDNMNQNITAIVFLTSVITSALSPTSAASGAENGKMFLCADSATAKKDAPKMVYGYINGQKTQCMSEYDFLALWGKSLLETDSVALQIREKEANARKSDLKSASLSDSVAEQIRKGRKDLDGLDLMGIDLSSADLQKASFVSADLRRAKLTGADLREANFEAAFLKRVDLRGARFNSTNLKSAYLAEADLRKAKGLSIESLKTVYTLYKAKMDDRLALEVKDALPEKLKEPSKCWENNKWSDNDDCSAEKGLKNPAANK
jgi:uncharacterized protein YjbI with pentapeptide repeats